MRRAESLRLAAAVALAVGAVLLGQSLLSGHHHAARAGAHAGAGAGAGTSTLAPLPGSRAAIKQAAKASPASSWPVAVAGGPAVTRALQLGSMTVVIDQPSSGLFAEQNRAIERGASVAVDELDASGGLLGHIRVRLLPQALDGLSAAAVRDRLRSEAAAVLILPCDTDSQLGIAAGAARYGTLMLAPCNPDPTAGQRYPTYWPVGMGANAEALGLADFMSRFSYTSAFVINTIGSRYAELLTSYFRIAAPAKGVRLTGGVSMPITGGDVSRLADMIKSSRPRPSAIFSAAPPPFVNRLAAGLKAQGVDQAVVGTAAMDTPLSLSSDGQALENAVFPSYGFLREDASARRFVRDYAGRFRGYPAGSFPGLGLETIRLLEDAVRKAGSAQPSAIQRTLAEGITLRGEGLADRAYLPGGDHNPIGQIGITKIAEGGGFVPLTADPATLASSP